MLEQLLRLLARELLFESGHFPESDKAVFFSEDYEYELRVKKKRKLELIKDEKD